ncbi:putative WD repeat-containing protein [Neolecta irregularis DAH-3]|uniref:Putative WD repeat-containing protein n=1 Tax=Neolecta irregularis (strain DAH-3) TaxID=1198029 RepID=A0A1U7LPX1_NEOID|nr:putative WD repeat-containing protein [Neolecta irregularis DAH-3]|eukprot:OLL24633.1 putative WD repeat-containing protein [Neolecta irregularis DAH-3]
MADSVLEPELLGQILPVTAVSFSNKKTVLIGEGSCLAIFDVDSEKFISKHRLCIEKILGISYDIKSDRALIWGNNTLAVLSSPNFDSPKYITTNDWIHHAMLLSKYEIAVLTAHNAVTIYNITSSFIRQVFCVEQPLLCSGKLYLTDDGTIKVVAGTIFNYIQLWTVGKSEKSTIDYQMTTHEGTVFGTAVSPSGNYIASCSDDRTVRIWTCHGNEIAVGWGHEARVWGVQFLEESKLISWGEDTTVRLWNLHNGKLEAIKVFEGHEGKHCWSAHCFNGRMVSGGADGRVRIWDLEETGIERLSLDLSKAYEELGLTFPLEERYISFCLIGLEKAIASTYLGKIMIYHIATHKWRLLFDDARFFRSSFVKYWENMNYIGIADRNGKLLLLNATFTIIKEFEIQSEKIMELLSSPTQSNILLLTRTNSKNLEKSFYEIILPPDFEFASFAYDISTAILVLGSRQGAVCFYILPTITTSIPLESVRCCRRLHGREGVRKVSLQGNDLLTCGRDGFYNLYAISPSYDLIQTHSFKAPKGTIEQILTRAGRKYVYGFHDQDFYFSDESSCFQIFHEDCGGSKRIWDFHVDEKLRSTLIYMRQGQLHIRIDNAESADTVAQEGTHGREIRALSIRPQPTEREGTVFATGAEDCYIRVCLLRMNDQIMTLLRLKKHNTGIQALSWSSDGKYLFSSGGLEEFYVWKISDSKNGPIRAVLASECPTVSIPPDLRITSFDIREEKNENFVIVIGYSNSDVKIWLYNESTGFRIIAEGTWTQCCIMSVRMLGEVFMTAGTDGRIVLWDIRQVLGNINRSTIFRLKKPFCVIALHQSSIKAIEVVQVEDHQWKLSTGGDDNALTKSVLKIDPWIPSAMISQLVQNVDAHAACVTGVMLLDDVLVSVGLDRKMKFWSPELRCVKELKHGVADPGGIIAISGGERRIVLFGIGIQVYRVLGQPENETRMLRNDHH